MAILFACVICIHAQKPDDGLLLRLDFKDATGGSMQDMTGKHTLSALSGKIAVQDDALVTGMNKIYILSNHSIFNCTSELTLSFWLSVKSNTGRQYLLFKGIRDTKPEKVQFLTGLLDGRLTFSAMDSDGVWNTLAETPKPVIEANRWHHCGITYKNGVVSLFVDGKMLYSKQYSITSLVPNDAPIYIGGGMFAGANQPNAYFCEGQVKDIRIYNRSISGQEMKTLSGNVSDKTDDVPSGSRFGRNLLFNSSFELGDKGWSGQRLVKIDAEGKWDYKGQGWVIDNATARFGKNSIRLDVPENNAVLFSSHEFYANARKEVTVSFWAKSAAEKYPVQVMLRSIMTSGPKLDLQMGGGSFLLGRDWKRYSFAFTVGNEKSRFFYFSVVAGNDGKNVFNTPGTVWLDGLQTEEGKLSDYVPSSAVEAAVYVPEIIVSPGKIKGDVIAISYSVPQNATPIGITLKNSFFNRSESSQSHIFELKPGVPQRKSFEFSGENFGYFNIFTSLQPGSPDGEVFVYNRKLPLATQRPPEDLSSQSAAAFVRVFPPSSPKKGFRIGVQSTLDGAVNIGLPFPGDPVPFFADSIGTAQQIADSTRLAGGLMFREWGNKKI
ncbi:MAG: LamG domain-containing protein [Spirochaetota bacterium]